MGKDAKIHCESCHRIWDAPGFSAAGYVKHELESKPCPACGACTLAVARKEQAKRRGSSVRSFIVPKRIVKSA